MIIVLRVVGVASEMNGSWLAIIKGKKKDDQKSDKVKDTDDDFLEFINPTFTDLFHYTFNYIGLLTGNAQLYMSKYYNTNTVSSVNIVYWLIYNSTYVV